MLDLALLGLLDQGELHGYELRKRLRQQLGLIANVSFGSIYPALARLEAAGAVQSVEPAGRSPVNDLASVPPTGSLSGERALLGARRHARGTLGRRSRKAYRITPAGRQLFLQLLSGTGTDDARSFGLRWAFARHLTPTARLALLERRRAQLMQRLAEAPSPAGNTGIDGYARSVLEHTTAGVESDIVWLDRLIDAERTAHGAAHRPGARAVSTSSRRTSRSSGQTTGTGKERRAVTSPPHPSTARRSR